MFSCSMLNKFHVHCQEWSASCFFFSLFIAGRSLESVSSIFELIGLSCAGFESAMGAYLLFLVLLRCVLLLFLVLWQV
jgi:hypothetical protein